MDHINRKMERLGENQKEMLPIKNTDKNAQSGLAWQRRGFNSQAGVEFRLPALEQVPAALLLGQVPNKH